MIKRCLYSKLKNWSVALLNVVDVKFTEQFGFRAKDATFHSVVTYLYAPKDSSSLAVTRILFGMLMLFDIPDERGGAVMGKRWGDPSTCHFPLIPFIRPIPMPYMALVYAALWLGALGITVGYKYRISAVAFATSYWYLFLIEKSFWNNHSYLFGLVGLLLAFTEANVRWSIDARLEPSISKETVPYWNYFILKYQFFILYFVAGLKKGTAEWLAGYSVQKLSEHWVFSPFKLFLTVEQTDYLVVHCFIFLFDLTVAIWMMWSRTRRVAMVFCALFHLMNSRIFTIGMFPWVCLATMPLFCPFDWPITVGKCSQNCIAKFRKCMQNLNILTKKHVEDNSRGLDQKDESIVKSDEQSHKTNDEAKNSPKAIENSDLSGKDENEETVNNTCNDKKNEQTEIIVKNTKSRKAVVACVIGFYMFIQAILPYSHFITKGYNNWTNGLYGYSWDMMVQTWDIDSIVVKIVDKKNREEFYIDPNVYTPNDRWTRHGDMVLQYAACLKERLESSSKNRYSESMSRDVSIYIDVWCSMNGRFTQRMFDPKVDLVKASWSPFEPISFLMPLIEEALHWRQTLSDIREEINSQSSSTHVIFHADFPGYDQEKFIPGDLDNVTLTVLGGFLAFEPGETKYTKHKSTMYIKGDQIKMLPGTFHKVINIGNEPVYYMYTFKNVTESYESKSFTPKPKLPIATELYRRFKNMFIFGKIVVSSIFQILFGTQKCYEY